MIQGALNLCQASAVVRDEALLALVQECESVAVTTRIYRSNHGLSFGAVPEFCPAVKGGGEERTVAASGGVRSFRDVQEPQHAGTSSRAAAQSGVQSQGLPLLVL